MADPTWPWAGSQQSSDWPWLHNVSTFETPAQGDDYRSHHAFLRLFARGMADHLHDQRHRVGEHEFAQNHEESWLVPQRRCVVQTVLFGAEQHSQEDNDAGEKLEARAEPIYHPVWGKDATN